MGKLVTTAQFQNESRLVNDLVNSYANRYGADSTKMNDLQADILSIVPSENLKVDANGNFKIIKPYQLSQKIDIEELKQIRQYNKTYGQEKKETEEEYEQAKAKGQTSAENVAQYIENKNKRNNVDNALQTIYELANMLDDDSPLIAEVNRIMSKMYSNRQKTDEDISDLINIARQLRQEFTLERIKL